MSSLDATCVKVKIEDVEQLTATESNNNYDLLYRHGVDETADECYEDMIACSPASCVSDDVDEECRVGELSLGRTAMNMSLGLGLHVGRPDLSIVKHELERERDRAGTSETDFLDEDISQYEMDSFRSMMASYGTNIGSSGMSVAGGMIPRLPMSNMLAGGVAGAGHAHHRSRPIDKASVRRYCTHEADNVYRCNFCSKTYTHISNFCRHFLSAHHGIRQEIPCPVCFKLFTRKDNMMTHTKQVHRLNLVRGGVNPDSGPVSNTQPESDGSSLGANLEAFHPASSVTMDPS